ncbi:hypothetical protein P9112_013854 [Eukaryota sp. TZLM1-RC]
MNIVDDSTSDDSRTFSFDYSTDNSVSDSEAISQGDSLSSIFDNESEGSDMMNPFTNAEISSFQCSSEFYDSNEVIEGTTHSYISPPSNHDVEIITLACIQQDEAEDDLVYKIFNDRDEVLKFASTCFPSHVLTRNATLDFDEMNNVLFSTTGFIGPKDALLEFLSQNLQCFAEFVKKRSPSPGLYLYVQGHHLRFLLWPGDRAFATHSAPILTFTRLMFEFCEEVFMVLSESSAARLVLSTRRTRAAGRTFKPQTREVTHDDFGVQSLTQCHLNLVSRNGALFCPVMEASLVL